ncbi:hypothetical protein NMY22_g2023 [Coprinellus aureogranulatus]|nr:hypothetical protein NMY22_g2023 [Coprinellus aureogranulatus]
MGCQSAEFSYPPTFTSQSSKAGYDLRYTVDSEILLFVGGGPPSPPRTCANMIFNLALGQMYAITLVDTPIQRSGMEDARPLQPGWWPTPRAYPGIRITCPHLFKTSRYDLFDVLALRSTPERFKKPLISVRRPSSAMALPFMSISNFRATATKLYDAIQNPSPYTGACTNFPPVQLPKVLVSRRAKAPLPRSQRPSSGTHIVVRRLTTSHEESIADPSPTASVQAWIIIPKLTVVYSSIQRLT